MAVPSRRAAPSGTEERDVAEARPNFEVFFKETHQRLFGGLCLVTGSRHEAEEIMQDAYVKLWERWDRVSVIDDPAGFLFRTAMNLFRSRYRRAVLAVRRQVSMAPAVDDLALVEERDEVVRILRMLSPAERASVVLTTMFGYTSEEAGRLLGVKAATVRAHATRARASARATVEERS
jgi:RNA polymerase sigma-70 factor, ECF subfamily